MIKTICETTDLYDTHKRYEAFLDIIEDVFFLM